MNLQTWIKKGKSRLLSFGLKEWGMVLVAGICCMVIVFPSEKKQTDSNLPMSNNVDVGQSGASAVDVSEDYDYVKQLENRLTELLSGVKNVGKVKVMITVAGSAEKEVLKDGSQETEQITEQDSAGGSRNSVSERSDGTTVFYTVQGEEQPFIVTETYPEITGVVVLAEGSGTGTVDLDILGAVQVLFDVPAHKIKIMKMK